MRQQDLAESITKQIKELAKEQNISFAELCRRAGVSESTFYTARNSDGVMRLDTIMKFCEASDKNLIDFMISVMDEEDNGHITKDEKTLVECYRDVDPGEKEYILDYVKMIWNKKDRKGRTKKNNV